MARTQPQGKKEERGLRLLSLDGGGIRGLSELLILKEIMYRIQQEEGLEKLPRPCKYFDLIGGTSTGGIIAIMLGRLGMSLDEAISAYSALVEEVFSHPKYTFWNGKFRSTLFEQTIKDIVAKQTHFEDTKMLDDGPQRSGCKTFVCAMPALNMSPAIPRLFRSYQAPKNQAHNCTIWEAARATSASPRFFKRIVIGSQGSTEPYVDGGFGCNNPIIQVLEEANLMYPGRKVSCIVSLGTGHPKTIRIPKSSLFQKVLPSNILRAMQGMAMDCEREAQTVAKRFRLRPDVYFRLNVEQGMQGVHLEQWERLQEVTAHTRQYLATPDVDNRIEPLVTALREKVKTAPVPVAEVVGAVKAEVKSVIRLKTCPQPSPVFTGRGNVITQMTEHFAEDMGKRHIYVLYGLGGAGKSQIAYKFVQTSQTEPKGSRFSEVFFVDATSPETIRTDMENIARVKCEGGETVEDALRWLADEKKEWLILFNNADDTSLNLSQYFPQCAHGNILITTRNPQLRRYAPKANHQVADMEPDEAKDLLIRIVDPPTKGPSHTNGDQALSLVKELGFFALAIVQAGAYIANTNISIEEYLKLYARCRGELLEEYKDQVQKVDDYEWTVYTTWIISFQRLSKEAAKFLQLCAFLHHDGISESIFEKGATQLASYHPALQDEAQHFEDARQFIDHFKSAREDWDPLKFRKTVSEVQSYSLIDYDAPNQVYFIHPLVWEWTRTKMVSDTKATCTAMQCILGMSVSSELKMEDFAFRRGLVRHIDSALADGKVTGSDIAERFGRVLGEAGRWDDAEALEDPVVGFRKESLGMDHPDTLTSIANLATIYLNQKRLEEAQELELIVMEGRRKVLGVNDPKTLAAMNNLASIYSRQGRWKEAKALHVEVLKTKRQVLGERHPSTLTSMSNLAWIHCKQGLLDEAEKLQSFVLESRTEEFGEQHPSTLAAMGHLATTLKKKGRAEAAGALERKKAELEKKNEVVLSAA